MISPRGAMFDFDFSDAPAVRLTQEQQDAIDLWSADVWEFCVGVWPLPRHVHQKGSAEPRPIIWTQDKLAREPRPFPASYSYLKRAVLYPIFHAPKRDANGNPFRLRMVGWKPRQVFWTNAALIGMMWDTIFNEATEWLVAKNKKPEAMRFIRRRVRYTYEATPNWFQQWAAVPPKPRGEFNPPGTGSSILPVARTFGETGEAVGETASVFLDEAIRFRGLRQVWMAADAQAPRLIAISAPPERGVKLDPESLSFFRELAEGLPDGSLSRSVVGLDDLRPDADDDQEQEDISAWA